MSNKKVTARSSETKSIYSCAEVSY